MRGNKFIAYDEALYLFAGKQMGRTRRSDQEIISPSLQSKYHWMSNTKINSVEMGPSQTGFLLTVHVYSSEK